MAEFDRLLKTVIHRDKQWNWACRSPQISPMTERGFPPRCASNSASKDGDPLIWPIRAGERRHTNLPSFRRRPESRLSTHKLYPGLRRGDGGLALCARLGRAEDWRQQALSGQVPGRSSTGAALRASMALTGHFRAHAEQRQNSKELPEFCKCGESALVIESSACTAPPLTRGLDGAAHTPTKPGSSLKGGV